MASHTEAAGLAASDTIAQSYDSRTATAEARLLELLPEHARGRVVSCLQDAREMASARWSALRSGREAPRASD
eukprot:2238925-Karenia_brevis.AAC.1